MANTRRQALIIGIDTYYYRESPNDEPSLAALPHCKNNAEDLYNLLLCKKYDYTIFKNQPIIGSKFDKNYGFVDINRSIVDFFNQSSINQTLLFYFSGHGIKREGNEVYLATPQVRPRDPMIEGFALANLTKLVNSSKSRQIVCIIDSCYSGAATIDDVTRLSLGAGQIDKETAEAALSTSSKILENSLTTEGRYFLLSSQAYGKSYAEIDINSKNTIYTKYIIEGLKGVKPQYDGKGGTLSYTGSVDENGNVTPESLHEYADYKITSELEIQRPVLKSKRSGKILSLVHMPELTVASQELLLKLLRDGKIKDFNEKRQQLAPIILNFKETDLNGGYLKGANLSSADLSLTNLEGANLEGANLEGANLSGSFMFDCNLAHTKLKEANLQLTILRKSKLSQADLAGANLAGANLAGANLAGANLAGANLFRSLLISANLQSAHLEGANLEEADLLSADLSYANLSGVKIRSTNLRSVNLFKSTHQLPPDLFV